MTAAEVIRQEINAVRLGNVEPWSERILDALKAAGFAVVELPMAYPDDTDHPYWVPSPGEQVSVQGGGAVGLEMNARWSEMRPEMARAFAAALLAAADAAELVS